MSRFKAAATQKIESDAPPANIPRFKAAIKVPEKIEDANLNIESESEEKSKLAYKPRFKTGLTKKDSDSE